MTNITTASNTKTRFDELEDVNGMLFSEVEAAIARFVHEQLIADTVWVINHNLGRTPLVQIIDSSGSEVSAVIFHDNLNRTTLSFSQSFAGVAILD